jgi:amino acid transporter
MEQETVPTGQMRSAHLGTIHAVGQSLAIGPIYSTGLLTASIAAVAGYNTPLSVLLAFVGSLGMAYAIATFARRISGAGAVYEYLARGASRSFGVQAAGMYLAGLLLLGAGGTWLGIGVLTQSFFATHLHVAIPWWPAGVVALFAVAGLNWFGVRTAITGVLTLAALSAIPFLILAVAIIVKGGVAGNTLAVFDPSQTSWSAVFHGILFGITLFIGFEAAASIAEEANAPRRSIPIAMYATVIVSGLFFLLLCYAAAIGFGPKAASATWASTASPMGLLARQYVGRGLSVMIDLVVITDGISLAIAFTVTASRLIMALGRDRLLPSWTARITRHGTPGAGIGVVVGWGILLMAAMSLTTWGAKLKIPNIIEAVQVTIAAGSYLVELIYVFLAVFAFRLVWKSRGTDGWLWARIGGLVVGLAATGLAFEGSLNPFPPYPIDRGFMIFVAALVICLLWLGVLRIRRPDAIATAAAYAGSPVAEPASTPD